MLEPEEMEPEEMVGVGVLIKKEFFLSNLMPGDAVCKKLPRGAPQ